MKFLCAAIPEAGHVNPALPVVRSLVDSGHEVTMTTGAGFAAAVAGTGARFVPLPAGTVPDPAAGRAHGLCAPAAAQTRHLLALHAADPADALLADGAFVGARWVGELGGPPVGYYGTPYARRLVPPLGPGPRPGPLGRIRAAAAARRTATTLDRQRRALGLRPAHRTVLDWPADAGLLVQLSPAGPDHPRSDLPPTVHFVGTAAPPAEAAARAAALLAVLAATGRPVIRRPTRPAFSPASSASSPTEKFGLD